MSEPTVMIECGCGRRFKLNLIEAWEDHCSDDEGVGVTVPQRHEDHEMYDLGQQLHAAVDALLRKRCGGEADEGAYSEYLKPHHSHDWNEWGEPRPPTAVVE